MRSLVSSPVRPSLPAPVADILARDEENFRDRFPDRLRAIGIRLRTAVRPLTGGARVKLLGKWWESAPPLLDPSHKGGRPRKAAIWRDASEHLKVQFAHYAFIERGTAVAFALRLDDVMRDRLLRESKRKNAGARSFIVRQIDYRLQRTFNRRIDYWFVFEVTARAKNDLHIHGEIDLCGITDRSCLTKALRLAAGEFEPASRRWQAWLTDRPDACYVGYTLKDRDAVVAKARLARRKHPGFLGFDGDWQHARVKITSDLSKDAEAIYTEVRPHVPLA